MKLLSIRFRLSLEGSRYDSVAEGCVLYLEESRDSFGCTAHLGVDLRRVGLL